MSHVFFLPTSNICQGKPRPLGRAQFEERPQRGSCDGQLRLAHLAEPAPGARQVAPDAVRLDHRGVAEGVGLQLTHRHGLGDVVFFFFCGGNGWMGNLDGELLDI